MSDHVVEWLGAYLDGELQDGHIHKIEAHLNECQMCMEEYQVLSSLSARLHDVPTPDFPAPERFAAEVALRLPRTQVKPVRQKALEFGWWLAPVGLILVWVFINTTSLLSNMIATANELGLTGSASAWLDSGSGAGAYWSGTLGQMGLLAGDGLQWAGLTEAFTRSAVPQFIWQVSIALLYLSWMAIWWARHTRQEHDGLR